jgi:hypothetical protein
MHVQINTPPPPAHAAGDTAHAHSTVAQCSIPADYVLCTIESVHIMLLYACVCSRNPHAHDLWTLRHCVAPQHHAAPRTLLVPPVVPPRRTTSISLTTHMVGAGRKPKPGALAIATGTTRCVAAPADGCKCSTRLYNTKPSSCTGMQLASVIGCHALL